MINQDKWVASLPKNNNQFNEEINQLDPNKWVDTISKPNAFSSIKKYSLTIIGKKQLYVKNLVLIK